MRAKATCAVLTFSIATLRGLLVPVPTLGAQKGDDPPQNAATAVTEAKRRSIVAAAKGLKPEDVPELLQKAVAGDAEAQIIVGLAYEEGIAVEKDMTEALRWIRSAAELGHPMGQNALGLRYARGTGLPEDGAEAVRWFRKAADQGYSGGQTNLGCAYLYGLGVPKDAKEAAKWFRTASAQGHPEAQFQLAYLHDLGAGVQRDHQESARLYRQAAEQGHAPSQFNLGVAYHEGEGVPKDKNQAVEWLKKAGAQDHAAATYLLGRMYWDGEVPGSGGGVLSRQVALDKWEEAAEQGYPNAALNLAELYSSRMMAGAARVSRDNVKACMWFEIAKALDQRGDWTNFMGEKETARIRRAIEKKGSKLRKKLSDEELAQCQMRAGLWLEPPE